MARFKPTVSNQLGANSRRMPPTRKHRPILKVALLGTVYGISPEGEVRYFDYDWDAALEFAGVTLGNLAGMDVRYGKPASAVYLPGHDMWHPERRVADNAWWARDPTA